MPQVKTVKTTYTVSQLMESMTKVWIEVFGEYPKKESICIILAQNYVETGGKSFWNNNPGNTKFMSNNPNQDWMVLKGTWEIINGKKVILSENDPGSRFLSFATLDEGIKHHLLQLSKGKFKSAWSAVINGDPYEFARLLKVARYYTAPEKDYAKNMKFFFDKFMKDSTFEKVVFDLQEEQLKALPTFIFPLNIEDSFTNKTIEVDRRTYFASPEFRKGKKSDPEVTAKSTALTKKYANPFVKLFLIALNFFKNLTKRI
jgi:hypothetical protein